MNLKTAIEILEDIYRLERPNWPADESAAIKLGIEALKFVEADRDKYPYVKVPLLPGETKD